MIYSLIKKNILFFLACVSFFSCRYDGPLEVFDKNKTGGSKPIISNISPTDIALANFTKVKITGSGFGSGLDSASKNIVYFNNKKGTILSESESEIIVIPPNISGNEIVIKVSVPGSFDLAEFKPYRVELLSTKSDAFTPLDQIFAISVDADENIYASVRNSSTSKIFKVPPGGIKEEFGTVPFPATSDMKVGPNGDLYIQKISSKDLYRISSAGGEASVFVTLPKKVKYFDFDKRDNIYTGGSKSGIFRITSNGSITEVGNLKDFDIKSIRVFNEYVYFSALYKGADVAIPKSGIWKSKITINDGNIGNAELVFDWSKSGSFASSKIGSVTLSKDEHLLIGCDNAKNPILLVSPDGTSKALYPDLLKTKTIQIVWGNSNILYHNVKSNDNEIIGLYKIFVTQWESAPYFGRN